MACVQGTWRRPAGGAGRTLTALRRRMETATSGANRSGTAPPVSIGGPR